MRIELMTSSLPRKRSTPELHWRSLSGRRGSNPRPLVAWKANALPTELLPLFSFLSGDSCVGLRILGQSFTSVNSFPRRLSALNSSRNKLQIFQLSNFFVSFGRFLRWTSHPRSVIYFSKLLPSSLARLELIPKQTSDLPIIKLPRFFRAISASDFA